MSRTRDLARTIFLTSKNSSQKDSTLPDRFELITIDFGDKFSDFFGFVIIFSELFLRAQLELRKKLGHYEYLLLAKRSFLGFLFV